MSFLLDTAAVLFGWLLLRAALAFLPGSQLPILTQWLPLASVMSAAAALVFARYSLPKREACLARLGAFTLLGAQGLLLLLAPSGEGWLGLMAASVVWAGIWMTRSLFLSVPEWKIIPLRLFFFPALLLLPIATLGMSLFSTTGDEPHYLLIAHSLLHDRDVNQLNNYQEEAYRNFYWYKLIPKPSDIVTRTTIRSQGLGFLFPLFMAPGYGLGGRAGAVTLLLLCAAGCVALTWRNGVLATGNRKAALAATLFMGFAMPMQVFSYQVYPEMMAALVVAYVYGWIREPMTARRLGWLLVLSFWTVMMKVRFAPLIASLWVPVLWDLAATQRKRFWGLLGMMGGGGVFFVVADSLWFRGDLFWNRFGTFYQIRSYLPDLSTLQGGLGLLFDQEAGVLFFAPLWVLALGAWLRPKTLGRREWWRLTVILGINGVVVGSHPMWHGIPTPPGRYLAGVIPLVALFLADALTGKGGRGGFLRPVPLALGILSVGISLGVLTHQGWRANFGDGTSNLLQALDLQTALGWTFAFPSLIRVRYQEVPLMAAWALFLVALGWWGVGKRAGSAGVPPAPSNNRTTESRAGRPRYQPTESQAGTPVLLEQQNTNRRDADDTNGTAHPLPKGEEIRPWKAMSLYAGFALLLALPAGWMGLAGCLRSTVAEAEDWEVTRGRQVTVVPENPDPYYHEDHTFGVLVKPGGSLAMKVRTPDGPVHWVLRAQGAGESTFPAEGRLWLDDDYLGAFRVQASLWQELSYRAFVKQGQHTVRLELDGPESSGPLYVDALETWPLTEFGRKFSEMLETMPAWEDSSSLLSLAWRWAPLNERLRTREAIAALLDRDYSRAVALSRYSPSEHWPWTPLRKREFGIALLKAGLWSKAPPFFSDTGLVGADPKGAAFLLGVSRGLAGRYREALEIFLTIERTSSFFAFNPVNLRTLDVTISEPARYQLDLLKENDEYRAWLENVVEHLVQEGKGELQRVSGEGASSGAAADRAAKAFSRALRIWPSRALEEGLSLDDPRWYAAVLPRLAVPDFEGLELLGRAMEKAGYLQEATPIRKEAARLLDAYHREPIELPFAD